MKRFAIAAVLCVVLGPAFGPAGAATVKAAEGDRPAQGTDPNFSQRKALLLKMFDARIANITQAKSCVQKATNSDEIKTCMQTRYVDMGKRRGGAQKPGPPAPPKAP